MIAGGPRTGKSTLAGLLERNWGTVHDGEELVDLEWSAGSERAAKWLDESGSWICENVAMVRALRKWLVAHPSGSPADLVVVLRHPVVDRLPGQVSMAKGIETVWREIAPELDRRGTAILLAKPAPTEQPWIARNVSIPT